MLAPSITIEPGHDGSLHATITDVETEETVELDRHIGDGFCSCPVGLDAALEGLMITIRAVIRGEPV